MRVADTLTHAGLLEPFPAATNTLADGTVKLTMSLAPRGVALVASAFGALAAPAATAAVTARLIALRRGALPLAEAQAHVATMFSLNKHAAEGAEPVPAVAGRLVVPPEQSNRFSYLDLGQVGVQATNFDWALQDLTNAGCRALPVEPLRFATVEDLRARRFMQRRRATQGLQVVAQHEAAWMRWLDTQPPIFRQGIAPPEGVVLPALPAGPPLPEMVDLRLGVGAGGTVLDTEAEAGDDDDEDGDEAGVQAFLDDDCPSDDDAPPAKPAGAAALGCPSAPPAAGDAPPCVHAGRAPANGRAADGHTMPENGHAAPHAGDDIPPAAGGTDVEANGSAHSAAGGEQHANGSAPLVNGEAAAVKADVCTSGERGASANGASPEANGTVPPAAEGTPVSCTSAMVGGASVSTVRGDGPQE